MCPSARIRPISPPRRGPCVRHSRAARGCAGRRPAQQQFRRPVKVGRGFDAVAPVKADGGENGRREIAQGRGMAGGNDEIVRPVLLHHQVHRLDVLGRPAPVALAVEVAEDELFRRSAGDPRRRADDLAGDEGFRPQGGFVIEQHARNRVTALGGPVLGDLVVGVRLGDAVGAQGAEGRSDIRRRVRRAETFRRRGAEQAKSRVALRRQQGRDDADDDADGFVRMREDRATDEGPRADRPSGRSSPTRRVRTVDGVSRAGRRRSMPGEPDSAASGPGRRLVPWTRIPAPGDAPDTGRPAPRFRR